MRGFYMSDVHPAPSSPAPSGSGGVPGDDEERDDKIIVHAFGWSLVVLGLLVVAGGAIAYFAMRPGPPAVVKETPLDRPQVRAAAKVEIPRLPFTDVTAAVGIKFVHDNGAYGDKLLPETMGSGCAFFDFDNDGDQDL